MTGQFIIAGSLSAGACHAERYPRGVSWCQLNHIKIICKCKCIITKNCSGLSQLIGVI
ncbi:hypothetical protein AA219_004594 [Salmonella enterica subsp. enterica serovar Newport]|nr:hypothetical protein [Salmonella enterica subsp. enterica serovar Newport]